MKKHLVKHGLAVSAAPILLGMLLFMGGGNLAFGQTFKRYFKNQRTDNPQFFSIQDMTVNPVQQAVVIGGEFREHPGAIEAFGYTYEMGMDGLELRNSSVIVSTNTTNDGFRMGGVAVDGINRTYLAGSYSSDMSRSNTMNEKTISGLDVDGKLRWTKMEGSRHFADVTYDDHENALVAIGSPDGIWNNTQPISIIKMKLDGTLDVYKTIFDPVINEAVKVIDLPGGQGFIVVSIYDTLGLKAPYIIHVNQQLEKEWAIVYTDFLTEYKVEDATYHPDGFIGVSGTSYDPVNEEKHAFLLSARINGDYQYMNRFKVENHGDAEGFGITYAKHKTDANLSGFIVAGSYEPIQGTARRQALVFMTNIDGKPMWAYDYSDFPGQDFEEDEIAKKVVYLEDRNMFVVGGEYSQYIQNQQQERFIWMAKARIDLGKLEDKGICSASVLLDIETDSLGFYKAGSDTAGGGFVNFGYNFTSMNYKGTSCSYSYTADDLRTSIRNEFQPQSAELVEVYDLTGRFILRTRPTETNWKLGVQRGIYLLTYLKKGQIVHTEKLVLP